jgi:hypothetical protein
MPWKVFSDNTGILSTNDNFRLLITSSQTSGQITDGDVGNTSVTTDISFSGLYSDVIPEPAAATLIAGTGILTLAIRRRFA